MQIRTVVLLICAIALAASAILLFLQFYPVLVLPLLIAIRPPRYSGTSGLIAMMGFYGLAKILEMFDRQIGTVVSTGGHPWKHVAGAVAMFCYVNMVARRRPVAKN